MNINVKRFYAFSKQKQNGVKTLAVKFYAPFFTRKRNYRCIVVYQTPVTRQFEKKVWKLCSKFKNIEGIRSAFVWLNGTLNNCYIIEKKWLFDFLVLCVFILLKPFLINVSVIIRLFRHVSSSSKKYVSMLCRYLLSVQMYYLYDNFNTWQNTKI